MERTIRRDGFLFRYAYWFKPEEHRPERINRCPFFWRLLFVTLVGMPLWWLVWAPFSVVFGFLFAARPRFFRSDGNCDWACEAPWVSYEHWPRIGGAPIWPAGIIVLLAMTGAAYLALRLALRTPWFYGYSVLFWLVATAVTVVGIIVAYGMYRGFKGELGKTEFGRMARDAYRERKEGICPTYKVI